MQENRSDYQIDEEEQRHFNKIVESFKAYKYHSMKRVAKSLNFYHEMPQRQKTFLFDYEDNCKKLLKCIDSNYDLIDQLLKDVYYMFDNNSRDLNSKDDDSNDSSEYDSSLIMDIDRVYTTLKQIVRDWSAEGAKERETCYDPIINELTNLYPNCKSQSDLVSVLVPGAGLGRLAFEIAKLGFKCQGNEFSLHMLITSNFILNKCYEVNQFTFYPYIHNWSNLIAFEDQIKAVQFPDISPFDYTDELFQFSMAAGDFMEIYNEKNSWDSVVTCYFIDTARNIIDYIEKIWLILKPGGYWINFGPLLYHFSDINNEKSIELSYEQIKRIIQTMGFKYLKEQTNVSSKYLENEKSMLRYIYNCVFFTVQKPY